MYWYTFRRTFEEIKEYYFEDDTNDEEEDNAI